MNEALKKYINCIGLDTNSDINLLYIAYKGFNEELPSDYTYEILDSNIVYRCVGTDKISEVHPNYRKYRELVKKAKIKIADENADKESKSALDVLLPLLDNLNLMQKDRPESVTIDEMQNKYEKYPLMLEAKLTKLEKDIKEIDLDFLTEMDNLAQHESEIERLNNLDKNKLEWLNSQLNKSLERKQEAEQIFVESEEKSKQIFVEISNLMSEEQKCIVDRISLVDSELNLSDCSVEESEEEENEEGKKSSLLLEAVQKKWQRNHEIIEILNTFDKKLSLAEQFNLKEYFQSDLEALSASQIENDVIEILGCGSQRLSESQKTRLRKLFK